MADKRYTNQGMNDNHPQYRNRIRLIDNNDGTHNIEWVLGTVSNKDAKPMSGENIQRLEVGVSKIDDDLALAEKKIVTLDSSIKQLVTDMTRKLNIDNPQEILKQLKINAQGEAKVIGFKSSNHAKQMVFMNQSEKIEFIIEVSNVNNMIKFIRYTDSGTPEELLKINGNTKKGMILDKTLATLEDVQNGDTHLQQQIDNLTVGATGEYYTDNELNKLITQIGGTTTGTDGTLSVADVISMFTQLSVHNISTVFNPKIDSGLLKFGVETFDGIDSLGRITFTTANEGEVMVLIETGRYTNGIHHPYILQGFYKTGNLTMSNIEIIAGTMLIGYNGFNDIDRADLPAGDYYIGGLNAVLNLPEGHKGYGIGRKTFRGNNINLELIDSRGNMFNRTYLTNGWTEWEQVSLMSKTHKPYTPREYRTITGYSTGTGLYMYDGQEIQLNMQGYLSADIETFILRFAIYNSGGNANSGVVTTTMEACGVGFDSMWFSNAVLVPTKVGGLYSDSEFKMWDLNAGYKIAGKSNTASRKTVLISVEVVIKNDSWGNNKRSPRLSLPTVDINTLPPDTPKVIMASSTQAYDLTKLSAEQIKQIEKVKE